MIRCEDWRRATPEEIGPLLDLERGAWRRDLDWDLRTSWQAVEPARRAGTLPGFVARDRHGRIAGWTSFLLHHDNVQVLAFVASSADVTTSLVDAILECEECAAASAVLFCVRSAADTLIDTLQARGFRVEPYRYLRTELKNLEPVPAELRHWAGDADRLARLFERAYDVDRTTRAFAPAGTREEWDEYVVTLLTTTGCGRFLPRLSFVVPSDHRRTLTGAIVVTDLAPGTAHIAQIAVDPDERRQGLGGRLLSGALSAAESAGYVRMTLLVAASNRAALALYHRAGFRDRSTFVVAIAGRDMLSRRATYAAPEPRVAGSPPIIDTR